MAMKKAWFVKHEPPHVPLDKLTFPKKPNSQKRVLMYHETRMLHHILHDMYTPIHTKAKEEILISITTESIHTIF